MNLNQIQNFEYQERNELIPKISQNSQNITIDVTHTIKSANLYDLFIRYTIEVEEELFLYCYNNGTPLDIEVVTPFIQNRINITQTDVTEGDHHILLRLQTQNNSLYYNDTYIYHLKPSLLNIQGFQEGIWYLIGGIIIIAIILSPFLYLFIKKRLNRYRTVQDQKKLTEHFSHLQDLPDFSVIGQEDTPFRKLVNSENIPLQDRIDFIQTSAAVSFVYLYKQRDMLSKLILKQNIINKIKPKELEKILTKILINDEPYGQYPFKVGASQFNIAYWHTKKLTIVILIDTEIEYIPKIFKDYVQQFLNELDNAPKSQISLEYISKIIDKCFNFALNTPIITDPQQEIEDRVKILTYFSSMDNRSSKQAWKDFQSDLYGLDLDSLNEIEKFRVELSHSIFSQKNQNERKQVNEFKSKINKVENPDTSEDPNKNE